MTRFRLSDKWIRVDCSRSATGDFIDIRVTDSGKGIAFEIREKLMQPFFTTKAIGKGTGLGLAIASGIAQQHGGKLRYDEKSPNTSFVMSLPCRHAGEASKKAA